MSRNVIGLRQDPQRVTAARLAAGYKTKNQLAVRIGKARSLLTEIERGTRSASEDTLEKIAEACGCAVEELMPEPERTAS